MSYNLCFPGILAFLKVLIVEDEVIVTLDLQNRLETRGYKVLDTFMSGEEACEKVLELQPDLVLMDIQLGGDMDGIETAKVIQAYLDVLFVFITAYADKNVIEWSNNRKPYTVIRTPFDEQELYKAIEVVLKTASVVEVKPD